MTESNYSTRLGSNEPGSVMWLATRYKKIYAVVWRNQIEKLTTLEAEFM